MLMPAAIGDPHGFPNHTFSLLHAMVVWGESKKKHGVGVSGMVTHSPDLIGGGGGFDGGLWFFLGVVGGGVCRWGGADSSLLERKGGACMGRWPLTGVSGVCSKSFHVGTKAGFKI